MSIRIRLCYTAAQFELIPIRADAESINKYLRNKIISNFPPSELCLPCREPILIKWVELDLPAGVEATIKKEAANVGLQPAEFIRRKYIDPLLLK